VLIVGDGHGILAALIKDRWPESTVTLVDLGRTLLFQTVNCQRAYPTRRHALVRSGRSESASGMDADFVYCPADRLEDLHDQPFDLAVNIASMQEMTPEVVASYFSFLRRRLAPSNLFYCCNRERKVLPGGEVSALAHYPWREGDRTLIDAPCPWHQYFVTPGRKRLPVPFVRRYDGVHRHRLVTLLTDPQ
jgi:SAM-dependent methyltransferase